MSAFNPLVPTGLVNLDSDYKNIQNNFQQLDTSFGVDHLPFSNGTNVNGYHKQIHLINESNPGIGNASGVLYANILNGQSYPYWTNALGTFPLLGATTAAASGSVTLPGGIILKWGTTAIPSGDSSTGTQTFASSGGSFSTAAYVVLPTLVSKVGGTSSSNDTIAIRQASTNISQFTWDFNGTSGSYTFFNWIAIGK